jgi:hypothetical protein
VTELEARPDAGGGELAALARSLGAEAALRVQQRPIEVELWTARPIGDPEGTLDVIREPGASRHEQEVLVLRVVETLRALGLEPAAPAAEEPAAAEPPSPAAAPTPTSAPQAARAPAAPAEEPEQEPAREAQRPWPARAPQLWIELLPSLAVSPGGLGPQLQAQLGVRYQPIALLSISGFALAPLWRSELERAEGSASASTWLLGLAADAHYSLRPIELSAGLGIASAITVMSGQSRVLDGTDETELTAAPLARAALHVELGASLRLCVRALIGASLPEISMRFVEREVASWGRPFAVIGVGLELPVIAHPASQ